MKISIPIFLLTFTAAGSFAQKVSTNMVGQLVSAENYFVGIAKEKGINEAFQTVSDDHTIVFRPQPVNALKFYKEQEPSSAVLSWHPVYARISKSGDWGFTTGPYVFREDSASTKEFYGDYISVWKKNGKNVWKLALDAGVSHPKPAAEPPLNFPEPSSVRYRKMLGKARIEQREDIVMTTDKLFALQLRKTPYVAYNEFLHDEATLFLPGVQPIDGKTKIVDYLQKNAIEIETHSEQVDRAFSGDLAYTYGTATISKGTESKNYTYVRIWEVGYSYKWNVLLEMFIPA